MASLERLRRNRGVVRASVTRIITLLTDELRAPVPDAAEVDCHVADLTQKNVELASLNRKIFDATDDDAYEEELEAAEEYERKVSYAVSRARFFLRGVASETAATRNARLEARSPNADAGGPSTAAQSQVSDSSRVADMTSSQGTMPRHRTVVLPKLQIPTFSGALREWQPFWDHFSATIHLNEALLQIEKFIYLQSYLSGAAKRAIEGIPLTEGNYSVAINALTERFGRRDLLINEHVDHLLALRPVKSSADVENLRMLHDQVQFQVSALTGLGVPPEQYDVVLNHVLMKCMPDDLAVLYRQKVKEAPQDASAIATPEERVRQAAEMLSFLRIQIEIREEGRPGQTMSGFSRLLPEEVTPPPAPVGRLPTASALAGTCWNCGQTSLPDCDAFATRRLDIVGIEQSAERKNKALPELEAYDGSTMNICKWTHRPLNQQFADIPSGCVNRRSAKPYAQSQFNRFPEKSELLKLNDSSVKAQVTEEHAHRVGEHLQLKENISPAPSHAFMRPGGMTRRHDVFHASLRVLNLLCQKDIQLETSKLDAEVVQILIVFRCQPSVSWKFVGDRIPWWGGWSERHPIYKSCIEVVIWEQQSEH